MINKFMLLGSTTKNINLLNLLIFFLLFVGSFNFLNFNIHYILLSILSFYFLNILGVWLTLHRYYSHRSFQFKNKFLYYFFTIISILTARGSPLGWVYLHRHHHKYSDTKNDPHSPALIGFKIFGFDHFLEKENSKMDVFMVKDIMNKEHLFIHKYYIFIIFMFITISSLINFKIFYFLWVIPVVGIHLSQSIFNYFGHTYGYKNFTTTDSSKNNMFLFPIILGEAWHNNHHANPKKFSTSTNKFEIDPLTWLLKILGKTTN